jgi:hypothetical protein
MAAQPDPMQPEKHTIYIITQSLYPDDEPIRKNCVRF